MNYAKVELNNNEIWCKGNTLFPNIQSITNFFYEFFILVGHNKFCHIITINLWQNKRFLIFFRNDDSFATFAHWEGGGRKSSAFIFIKECRDADDVGVWQDPVSLGEGTRWSQGHRDFIASDINQKAKGSSSVYGATPFYLFLSHQTLELCVYFRACIKVSIWWKLTLVKFIESILIDF